MQYNITYRKKDNGWQYIISYKDKYGKWKQKSKQGFTGGDKQPSKECKTAALDTLKLLEKDIELRASLNDGSEYITFKEFSDMFKDHKKLYNSYKTVQSTQTVLNKFSDLDTMALCQITTLDIQKIVDEMTLKELNPNTIKYYLKKLSIIFNSAKNEYNYITVSPIHNIKVSRSKPITKKALTEDEVDKLLKAFKNTEYYLLIFIAVNTGMRIGEILGLTWNKIDLTNNEISVERQWKKNNDNIFTFGDLKHVNSERKIPISKDVCKVLKSYKNVINIDTRIFDFNNKDSVISTIDRMFKSKGFKISFHELRHTYGSKLIANGLDYKTVAEVLGHDVTETIKTYSHVNSDMRSKAKKLIESIF